MRFSQGRHRFYCGIDLHARTISLRVLDQEGKKLLHQSIDANPEAVLGALAPIREGLVVVDESMFA